MEKQQNKKCSSKEHGEIDAVNYCDKCKVYMCKNCTIFHSKLLQNHNIYNLNEEMKDIFTGFCNEENHGNKLEFYCKNHNILCCAACICKMNEKGYGLHKDCETYIIENIKEEKQNKLEKNMKMLEELSNNIENSINELKNIFDKINNEKEEIKIKIQKIFTKIRTEVNNREEQLLMKVDEKYDDLFFKEELIKTSEKLPQKIKIFSEKGKSLNKFWNEYNKLSSLINDCIILEKNIEQIKEKQILIRNLNFLLKIFKNMVY